MWDNEQSKRSTVCAAKSRLSGVAVQQASMIIHILREKALNARDVLRSLPFRDKVYNLHGGVTCERPLACKYLIRDLSLMHSIIFLDLP